MKNYPSVTPDWPQVAEQLARLVESVGDIAPDLHRRVPSDDLWQFKALVDTGEDILMTTIVTLRAIEELKNIRRRSKSYGQKVVTILKIA